MSTIRIYWKMYPGHTRGNIKAGKTGMAHDRWQPFAPGSEGGAAVPVICGVEVIAAGGIAMVGVKGEIRSEIHVGDVIKGVVLNISKRCLDADMEERWGRDALTGIWVSLFVY